MIQISTALIFVLITTALYSLDFIQVSVFAQTSNQTQTHEEAETSEEANQMTTRTFF
jgi:hypothetical protein